MAVLRTEGLLLDQLRSGLSRPGPGASQMGVLFRKSKFVCAILVDKGSVAEER
jgi:hypothetical protein